MADMIEAEARLSTVFRGLLVRIRNETPANWDVTITAATATFVYADRSKTDATQAPIVLRSGDYTYLQSLDKCVAEHLVALRVEVDGGTQVLTKSYPGQPGRCQTRNDIILAPALTAVSETGNRFEDTPAKMMELR